MLLDPTATRYPFCFQVAIRSGPIEGEGPMRNATSSEDMVLEITGKAVAEILSQLSENTAFYRFDTVSRALGGLPVPKWTN